MKISNTASVVRATFTPTEIADLQFVIEAAERAGHYMPARVPNMAQSAPSCDFGQVGERFGNVAFGIDDGNHRRGQFAPS